MRLLSRKSLSGKTSYWICGQGEGAASNTCLPLASTLFLVSALALFFTVGCGILAKTGTTSSTTPNPLQLTTTSVPNGTVQQPYAATLSATGGTTPYSWTMTSGALPSGLTLNASSGAIGGTPTQGGTFGFTAQVRDSSPSPQTATRALTLIVNSTGLQITTTGLPPGTVGTSYSATLSATGGTTPYSWSVTGSSQLPPGLTLSTTGVISGTPTTAGTFTFQVQVRDSGGLTSSRSFSINITILGACGPPAYCSRTDLTLVPLPSPIPTVGDLNGANTVITDPDFSNRIVRITDANTDPSIGANSVYQGTGSGSADLNTWNTNSTLFTIHRMNAGHYIIAFDPVAMQASRLYVSSFPSTGGMTLPNGAPSWSYANSQILFMINGTVIQSYDFTNRSVPPTAQNVFDFATGSPTGCPGVSGSSFDLTTTASDDRFGTAFGTHVVVWSRTQGCRELNIATGVVTGDFGPTGTLSTPTCTTLHNVRFSKDGAWAVIIPMGGCTGPASAGPYYWQVDTLNVTFPTSAWQGHFTQGFQHSIPQGGAPTSQSCMNFPSRAFGTPDAFTTLIPNPPTVCLPGFESHYSYNNADVNDTTPIFGIACNEQGGNTTWCPWHDEVFAVKPDGSGTVYRFCHTFNTNLNPNFQLAVAIGTVSQDGRFLSFSSDWQGTLGSQAGGTTCTVTSNCRGDVFVVELK